MSNNLTIRYQLRRKNFESNVDLSIPSNGITAIFGRSGSGKTTLLRCIAGLEKVSTGFIQFRDTIFQSANTFSPIHKRPIGYVFQQPNLFPHLSVEQNLLYGYKRIASDTRKIHFSEAVELLGIKPFLQRYPQQLSGGQQQRVGIARALLTSPHLLLMDEPLASLDAHSKAEILPYLERLHQQLDTPILYVSHSIEEVVQIADRMILMEQGTVLAEGPLNDLLTDQKLPLTHLEEACVVTDGVVEKQLADYHLTHLNTEFGDLVMSQKPLAIGSNVRVKIMARDVSLALDFAERTSISNILPVTIDSFIDCPDPAQILVKLNAKGTPMLSRITRRSMAHLNLKPGQLVYAQIKSVSLMRNAVSTL